MASFEWGELMNPKGALFLIFIIFVCLVEPKRGIYVSEKSLSRAYIYYVQPDYRTTKKIVSQLNGKSSDAAAIRIVSRCLKIDAIMLKALINTESAFQSRARSHTGAVGLTQFTSIGVKEVNLQVSGWKSQAYFRKQLNGCILPRLGREPLEIFEKSIQGQKKQLLVDREAAVIYGGILLKTLLASEWSKGRVSTFKAYFHAIERYNGSNAIVKRRNKRMKEKVFYRNTVLKTAKQLVKI